MLIHIWAKVETYVHGQIQIYFNRFILIESLSINSTIAVTTLLLRYMILQYICVNAIFECFINRDGVCNEDLLPGPSFNFLRNELLTLTSGNFSFIALKVQDVKSEVWSTDYITVFRVLNYEAFLSKTS